MTMFLLSKLLPLLLLPLGLAMLLLLWAAIRGGRAPVIAALGMLWLFATPLTAEGLWRWLERPYQRQSAAAVLGRRSAPVAAVVVLGTGRHAAPAPPAPANGPTPIASSAVSRLISSCAAWASGPS